MKKIALLLLILVFSCSKRKSVNESEKINYLFSGTIVDCDDVPIVGATISLDDYNMDAQSNDQGEWSVTLSNVLPCEESGCLIKILFINNDGESVYSGFRVDDFELSEDGFYSKSSIAKKYNIEPGNRLCVNEGIEEELECPDGFCRE